MPPELFQPGLRLPGQRVGPAAAEQSMDPMAADLAKVVGRKPVVIPAAAELASFPMIIERAPVPAAQVMAGGPAVAGAGTGEPVAPTLAEERGVRSSW